MRVVVPALVLGLALTSCAAAHPLSPAFDGTWDLTPADCADPDGVTRLGIADSKLQYYEWGGDVLSVRPNGDGSVQVNLDWWDTSDTDANDQPILRRRVGKLTLSPDRSRLQVAIDGDATPYVRCPETPSDGLRRSQNGITGPTGSSSAQR